MPGPWIVATGNAGKLVEIRALFRGLGVELQGLAAHPAVKLPPEDGDYDANAVGKARAAAVQSGRAALGDDSGLEVDALGGRPGVHSARYGGAGLDDAGRVRRLLVELADVPMEERTARFVCVAAFVTPDGDTLVARGDGEGRILQAPRGDAGFGYDPIFVPQGHTVSMAELSQAEKNVLSHRARAFTALRARIRAAGFAS